MTHAWSQWEGQIINGEFQLQKYLCGWEQSAVFLTQQQAAIKLVSSRVVNAELQLDRWRLAQSLSHPHLIRILQTGRCRLDSVDLIFVVMEYAEENLAQILSERPLTPAEVCQMLEPALAALAYLHGQGLVHGCLQPANIMATNDQLKLASDCVYKAGESFSDSGKRSLYDPPESTTGKASPAADLWSLGMTLAETLTQRLPSWSEHGQADPPLPEHITASLADIVRGCLRRDPQRRLTIADITSRLQFPAPPSAHPAPAPLPTPPPVLRENPKRASLAQKPSKFRLLVLGAILIAVLAVLVRMVNPGTGRKNATVLTKEQNRQGEKTGGSEGNANGQQPVIELRQSTPASHTKPSPATSQPEGAANTRNRPAESEVVQQVLPKVSQAAQDTIQGTVKVSVKVDVDRSGNVVGSGLDSPGPSQYFARLSMQAAQSWKFVPSDQDDKREFLLRFNFTNTATKTSASRVGR